MNKILSFIFYLLSVFFPLNASLSISDLYTKNVNLKYYLIMCSNSLHIEIMLILLNYVYISIHDTIINGLVDYIEIDDMFKNIRDVMIFNLLEYIICLVCLFTVPDSVNFNTNATIIHTIFNMFFLIIFLMFHFLKWKYFEDYQFMKETKRKQKNNKKRKQSEHQNTEQTQSETGQEQTQQNTEQTQQMEQIIENNEPLTTPYDIEQPLINNIENDFENWLQNYAKISD